MKRREHWLAVFVDRAFTLLGYVLLTGTAILALIFLAPR